VRKEWNEFINSINDNTFFLSWERIAPSVKYLEQGSTIKILFGMDGNDILGIAPLRKTSRFFNGQPIYSVIESLSDRAFGILLAKRKAECLKMFLTYLYNQKDWDFLYFNDVPETFPIVDLLKKNSEYFPYFDEKEGDVAPYLTIPDSLDELFRELTPKFRKNLRMGMRKIERDHGKVELKEYYELGSLEEMMQVFFEIHQKRWESLGEPGAFKTKRNRNMFLYEAKLLSEINCLKLRFLVVNGKPISGFYGFEYDQVLYVFLTGFDPDYSYYSPSNLQILKILERCIEENTKEFNFFGGYTSYKFNWCKAYRKNFTFRFVNKKLSSTALNLGMRLTRNSKINRFLENTISF